MKNIMRRLAKSSKRHPHKKKAKQRGLLGGSQASSSHKGWQMEKEYLRCQNQSDLGKSERSPASVIFTAVWVCLKLGKSQEKAS